MTQRSFIDDVNDPRLAEYQSIREPELARSRGLFVAEGRLVVQRVIESGRYRVRSVLVNDAAGRALAASLDRVDAPVFVGSTALVAAVAGYNMHRGCVALVERPAPLLAAAAVDGVRTVVALEGVGNADNVGGVFRNAAAFGAAVVLSRNCCDPLYRKAIRTSMGAALTVPWAWVDDWPDGLLALRARGYEIASLTPRDPAETLDVFAGRARGSSIVLVAGTEGEGLSDRIVAEADARVRIPIAPAVDSLNVAVAVGIALWRLSAV
jgi:tRNA G18 (ribose-2'-O)-methylase SpoU